ncbi:AraC family transcriptional regulator [Legionella lansingensis]|uniref:AraC family transcriptional regulator n=2 Tax=Legionella lansingensis TaxID=45067 RepID=A0A0W0VUJ9_9GAMM|nr:helix-turn-helix domain-containing protein [Legionella lansingensis]KTD23382.1 AraC family transcriptional regulator [Legionella lansingensis]SNV49469.1 AraC family transcriptional regulator [Legionella lansingensis]
MSNIISLRSYKTESASHSHEFAQIVLPIRGSLELEIEGRGSQVKDGIGAYIATNSRHCFAGSQDNLFLVADLPKQSPELKPFVYVTATVKKFICFTHSYLQTTQDPLTDYLLYQLMVNVLSPSSLLSHRSVQLAKEWIAKHLAAPMDISKLARHCCLSKSQLQRRFKEETGLGLAEYWRIKKLEYAQMLLSKAKLSIEEIAFEVGYENLSAFSRRFTKFFCMTPSQWRHMTLTAKSMRPKDKN